MRIAPQPGPQEIALQSTADILIYGGQAGGGKTYALLMEPLYHVENPAFRAVIFRSSHPQIIAEGGLWDTSMEVYPYYPATPIWGRTEWIFPSSATVRFAHMGHENVLLDYQGAQIPLIEWDELTQFRQRMFFFMLSRNRSTSGVRPYMRASCNPDAGSWVRQLIDWWIDNDTGLAIPERSGVIRYLVHYEDEFHWADDRETLREQFGEDVGIKSMTFVPASVWDNPLLLERDPNYLANLKSLNYIDRERLLGGNWNIIEEAGNVFNRGWFDTVPAPPPGGMECLFWDFASTDPKKSKSKPDWTVGVAIRFTGGRFYVTRVYRFQKGPVDTESFFLNLSSQWYKECLRIGVRPLLRWELEPGSGSRRDAMHLIRELAKRGVAEAHAIVDGREKILRARPFATQAEAGNVLLVDGEWNEQYLKELHSIPQGANDDIMDGSGGSFNAIMSEVLGGTGGSDAQTSGSYQTL